MSPQVGTNDFTEREGIIKVALVANQARCVWRETLMRDVGIDGQIEYVTPEGEATGRMIGVQVKSGPTWFKTNAAGEITYSVPEKHARYWESFPLPVALVLHEEKAGLTISTDARGALRQGENPIHLDPDRTFGPGTLLHALAMDGPLPTARADAMDILREMAAAVFVDQGVNVNFLDLFSFGLIDLSRSLYFGMDTFVEAAQGKAAASDDESGMAIGAATYEYIDRYVGFLVARDLARVDFDSWRRVAEERQMVGQIMGSLTSVGREVVGALRARNVELDPGLRGPVNEERVFQFLPLRIEERGIGLKAIAESFDA